MTRQMNKQMQMFGIGRMLSGTRVETDMFDIRAHVDPTLSFSENRENISKMLGVNRRNRGLEQHEQAQQERARAKAQREDVLRQVGHSWYPELDRARSAMRPGKRVSESGRRYYERRTNRSDRPPGKV
jgi:hypothetical protein